MNLSEKNYIELYKFQDKVFEALEGNCGSFYLTGGTALSRYYLNHRYSEDLDFFVNDDPDFEKYYKNIRTRLAKLYKLSDDKITAVVSSDEPKDVFDIIAIATNYFFNWSEVFNYVIRKAVVTEPGVVRRLRSFPIELFKQCDWYGTGMGLSRAVG